VLGVVVALLVIGVVILGVTEIGHLGISCWVRV
jgi:hypothetical protein